MAKMTPLAIPSDQIMLFCPAAAEDDRETAAPVVDVVEATEIVVVDSVGKEGVGKGNVRGLIEGITKPISNGVTGGEGLRGMLTVGGARAGAFSCACKSQRG
jgi:hypothetical protein